MQRCTTDEFVVRIDESAEFGIEWCTVAVHFVSVQRIAHFKPQRVAGAESGWLDLRNCREQLPYSTGCTTRQRNWPMWLQSKIEAIVRV